MAMKLGEGGEQYTPMARAIIGGLTTSVLLTIFIVPAAYLLVYRKEKDRNVYSDCRRSCLLIAGLAAVGRAQAPPKLTLQEAEAIAIKNHPQIQAAQNELNYARQQIVVNRSAYYPTIKGEITGLAGQRSFAYWRRRPVGLAFV